MSASFESQLVAVAQGVFEPHRSPPVPEMPRSTPATLSGHCIEAIKQAITIGSTELLVRRATGWRHQRFANAAQPGAQSAQTIRGRIWERHPQFHLRFSDRAIQTLADVATGSLLRNPGELEELPQDPGDTWLDFLLYRRYRKTNLGVALRKYRAIQSNGLIQLAYVADFTNSPESEVEVSSWLCSSLSAITESFQSRLAQRWLKLELEKRRMDSATRMRERARRQDLIMTSWIASCEASQRRDLARFLLILGRDMVHQFRSVHELFARIRWEDRRIQWKTEVIQVGLATARHYVHLDGWTRWARSVAYVDDGYETAQLWLADWEHYQGDSVTSTFRQWMSESTSLAISS